MKKDPTLEMEKEYHVQLPDTLLTTHLDLSNITTAIEIKPMYKNNYGAYIQTLLQKYICPDKTFYIFEYVTYRNLVNSIGSEKAIDRSIFPIKTDITMARVYTLRVYTAIFISPPRLPDYSQNHYKCKYCTFKVECANDDDYDWSKFKILSDCLEDKIPFLDTATTILKDYKSARF